MKYETFGIRSITQNVLQHKVSNFHKPRFTFKVDVRCEDEHYWYIYGTPCGCTTFGMLIAPLPPKDGHGMYARKKPARFVVKKKWCNHHYILFPYIVKKYGIIHQHATEQLWRALGHPYIKPSAQRVSKSYLALNHFLLFRTKPEITLKERAIYSTLSM